MVWQFFIVRRVSEAVMNWAQGHGRNVADGGWTIGLTACILCCCGIIPVIGIFAAVAGLVCAIIWWAKVASFNALMSPKTA
jgi:hypothetical protein